MPEDTPEPANEGLSRLVVPVGRGLHLAFQYPTDWQLLDHAETIRTAMRVTEVLGGALATVVAKDAHYAGAWRTQGWRGNLARILSKSARLKAMLWRSLPAESTAEPATDTLVDLINLATFMTINRQAGNEWGEGRA